MADATSHVITQLLKYAEMGSFSETSAKKKIKEGDYGKYTKVIVWHLQKEDSYILLGDFMFTVLLHWRQSLKFFRIWLEMMMCDQNTFQILF